MDSQDSPDPKDNKTVFDVSKPGKIGPSATSRPIIVQQEESVEDPMVSGKSPKKDTKKADEPLILSHDAKTLTPSPEAAKAEEQKKEQEADSSESAEVSTIAEQAENKKQTTKENEEEVAKQTALEKLIEDKQYFVPISEPKEKRGARFLFITVLILLIIFIALNTAIDLGLFGKNLKPFIDLIKN